MAAIQEIVWRVRPDLIVETGIAHGGSLIFSSSMLELLGGDGQVLGIDISSTASALTLTSKGGLERNLTVAEACNGMRLLTAFLALGVATAYLDDKPIWQRVILVVAAVPIAIFCNVIRVSFTCWTYYIDKPEMGQDFMHFFAGIMMLIPAFGMLWGWAWLLRNLFVEDTDDRAEPRPAAEGAA